MQLLVKLLATCLLGAIVREMVIIFLVNFFFTNNSLLDRTHYRGGLRMQFLSVAGADATRSSANVDAITERYRSEGRNG